MTSHGDLVLVEGPRDAVATVTLNRPEKKNALSIALRDELAARLVELAVDETVKAVVVTGAGDVFCAGFDLDEFRRIDEPEFAHTLWESSDRYHRAMLDFPLPLVAAVNGPAVAGGFDLAVMCDIRVAATTARFAHPEVLFGDVVYGPLHDLVGGAVARDLCLTGREVNAEEALRLGIVSRMVAPADVHDEARATAAQIAHAPRDVLLRTKAKAMKRAGVDSAETRDL